MRNNPNPGEKELKTYEYNYSPPIRRPSLRREEDVIWQPPGEIGDFSATSLDELSPRAAPTASHAAVTPPTMWQAASSEQEILNLVLALSPGKQKEVIHKALGTLSKRERDEIAHEAGTRQLFQDTTDFIWKVIISGLVIILICSFIAIIAAVLAGANAAPLITIFAAAIAFMGGLLTPSPVQAPLRGISSSPKTAGDN
jgi:hypothetical protein